MNKFAYLFEYGDFQLLIKKAESEDGEPKLSLITHFDEGEVDFGFVIKDEEVLNLIFNDHEQIKLCADTYLKKLNESSSMQEFIKTITGD